MSSSPKYQRGGFKSYQTFGSEQKYSNPNIFKQFIFQTNIFRLPSKRQAHQNNISTLYKNNLTFTQNNQLPKNNKISIAIELKPKSLLQLECNKKYSQFLEKYKQRLKSQRRKQLKRHSYNIQNLNSIQIIAQNTKISQYYKIVTPKNSKDLLKEGQNNQILQIQSPKYTIDCCQKQIKLLNQLKRQKINLQTTHQKNFPFLINKKSNAVQTFLNTVKNFEKNRINNRLQKQYFNNTINFVDSSPKKKNISIRKIKKQNSSPMKHNIETLDQILRKPKQFMKIAEQQLVPWKSISQQDETFVCVEN